MARANQFVHLRARSHYSLLDAPVPIQKLVAAAREAGQEALALTDNGNLFGAVEFSKTCAKEQVRPILGMVAYVAGKSMREPAGTGNPTHDLTLLAENERGFENLKRLSSDAWLEGFSYRPRVDDEALAARAEGLIALSGGISSRISLAVQQGDMQAAREIAGVYRDIFGADRFFLEVARNGSEVQSRVTQGLHEISKETGIRCVATNDVHYLKREDWLTHDILLCIRDGKSVSDPNRFRMGSRELYLKTADEMAEAFSGWEDPLLATLEIADRCRVSIETGVYHLPVFRTGTQESPSEYFRRRCREGIEKRYGIASEEVQKRLEYEVEVIEKLGFVSYFLIVQDFIAKARSLGIPVGPGRGSAAGSIVAYALGITDIDPLRYSLLFERFLNPGRVSMPDIDIDFCGHRRDEVISYVRETYGHECVSQIITFGTMASRGVLRDVGRVLQIDLAEIDKIAKKVPQGPKASLAAALQSDPELKALRESGTALRRLFDLSLQLEGIARHSSVHAAGVVIADRPLCDYVPLARNGEDVVTQWQMTELEEVGLLKMDFLGLKTLTILNEAVRLIEADKGIRVDLSALSLDDPAVFDLVGRGDTLGVFQLESHGMRELLARLRPDTFEDIIAVLALYRPGPLGSGMVDSFVRRKHGEEKVTYYHESLRPVLESTYGIIVYQEQVMQIANVIGGFSMAEADNLRKAMGKKNADIMAKFRDRFVEGAVARGHDAEFAQDLFRTMEHFAGYGFNKSHSTAYALITYQTAWLKTHHRLEFLAANLTVESGNSDKIKEFVDEIRRTGTRLLPPHVNASHRHFRVEDGAIRYGLGAIKGLGSRTADAIAERKGREGYASIEDLCERLDANLLNKTALEALIKAGALDGLGRSRRASIAAAEPALRASASAREDRRKGQGLLFAAPMAPADSRSDEDLCEWSETERLGHEKEALGFYLSGHPFEKRGAFLTRLAGMTIAQAASAEGGASVRVAGMVDSVQVLTVKSGPNAGKKMARFVLEDLTDRLLVACFARTYASSANRIEQDAIVVVTGKIRDQGESRELQCDTVEPAEEIVRREVAGLVIHLDPARWSPDLLDRILEVVERHKGVQRLHVDVPEADGCHRVRTDTGIRVSESLLDELADVVGPENVWFTRA
ncbi:MAG: DNA polymerase III subunit alpha [Planctomycetota bacterium]